MPQVESSIQVFQLKFRMLILSSALYVLHVPPISYFIWPPLCFVKVDPVAARSEARSLIARALDRWFESRLRHGCLSSSLYVVLSCVGRGLATG
jgi:hypothetical protein